MPGQLDFGKVALADGFQQSVVSDVRQLVRTQGDGVSTAGAERAARPTRTFIRAAGRQGGMLRRGKGTNGKRKGSRIPLHTSIYCSEFDAPEIKMKRTN